MMKKILAVLVAMTLLVSGSALSFTALAVDQVAGARWFPCEPGRENDMLWEVEAEMEGCLCQSFDTNPEDTGMTSYLSTTYGEDGSLTIARTGADGQDFYWPRIRTLWLDNYPTMDWTVANTLYFDVEATNAQWQITLAINGMPVGLSKAIAEECGIASLESYEADMPAGHYKGSINVIDALEQAAAENKMYSAAAQSILAMGSNTVVPQVTIFYVGDMSGSVKINELYMAAANDVDGANCEYMDMGAVYGDEWYEDTPSDEPTDEPADIPADPSTVTTVYQQVTENGVEVTLAANKGSYVGDEFIAVALTAKNTNAYDLVNVSLEALAPAGYTVMEGYASGGTLETLKAGESVSHSVQFARQVNDTSKQDGPKPDGPKSDSPNTGDTTQAVMAVVIVLLAGAATVVAFKMKKSKQLMSLVLCAAVMMTAAGVVPALTADAAAYNTQVTLNVMSDGAAIAIVGNVGYETVEASDVPSFAVDGDYSEGIEVPELANADVTIMMAIDWNYLETNNNPEDPFAQYHATLLWRDAYAAQSGDVNIVTISDEQQTDYLATQTASGTAPDIIPANYDMTYPKWNAAGLTASMDAYADYLELDGKNPANPEEDLYNKDLMNKYFRWDGQSHAAIVEENVIKDYLVYNKTKFEQSGEKTPLEYWQEGAWNWTQFKNTAKTMTNGDDYGFTGWGLFPYFAPYPMAKLDESTGEVVLNIDTPEYMTYMTEVYDLYQKDNAARCDVSLQTWSSTFPSGIDAMVQTSLDGYKHIVKQAEKMNGDVFGIAPVPAFDPNGEEVGVATATLWGYSIAAAAQNPEGAAAYIALETKVSRNIDAAFEGKTWLDKNLTDDEKAMIEATANDPVCVEMIRGIGDCYLGIIDAQIVPPIYYEKTENSVLAIFDAQKNALQAEIEDFNQMAEEIAAEQAAKDNA